LTLPEPMVECSMGVKEKERLVEELEQKLEKAENPFSMLTVEHLKAAGMKAQYRDYYIAFSGADKQIMSLDFHRDKFLEILHYTIKYYPEGYRVRKE
jgi:superfamily II RNA helicase